MRKMLANQLYYYVIWTILINPTLYKTGRNDVNTHQKRMQPWLDAYKLIVAYDFVQLLYNATKVWNITNIPYVIYMKIGCSIILSQPIYYNPWVGARKYLIKLFLLACFQHLSLSWQNLILSASFYCRYPLVKDHSSFSEHLEPEEMIVDVAHSFLTNQ